DYLEGIESDDVEAVRDFWTKYLAKVEPATGLVAPGRKPEGGPGFVHTRFTAAETEEIRKSIAGSGFHLSGYALAAWAIVFQRYTLRTEQIVGTVRHGRAWSFEDPRTLLGMF